MDLLHAEAAVGAAHRAVGVHADAVAPDVGELVGAAAGVARRADDVHAVAAIAAAVPKVLHLLGLHPAFAVHAGDQRGLQALAHHHRVELLGPRDLELHPPAAGAHGQRHGDGLDAHPGLAPEAAPHVGDHHPDVAVGQPEAGRKQVAHGEGALGRGVHLHAARLVETRHGHVGLHGHVLDLGHHEGVFHHVGAALQGGVVVPLADLQVVRHVGARAGRDPGDYLVVAELRVYQGGVFAHPLGDVEDRRQRLVVHRHPPGRLGGGLRRLGRHRGHRVAHVAYAVGGEHGLVLEVDAHVVREVPPADHRPDPRHVAGRLQVDGPDAGVGVGRAHHVRVQHPRELEVAGVAGGAGDLLQGVHPRDVVPDDACRRAHGAPPASPRRRSAPAAASPRRRSAPAAASPRRRAAPAAASPAAPPSRSAAAADCTASMICR